MKKYKLIIFDCDGTLVDSETITNQILVEMLGSLGMPLSLHEIKSLFLGKSMNDILRYIKDNRSEPMEYNFVEKFRSTCNERFATDLQVFDGVNELLDRIETQICIASNGPREKMEVTLKTTQLTKYFQKEDIFSAYDYEKWKPDPTMFEEILRHYNINPEDALVIEDSVAGIDGAINAGIDVFAFCPEEINPDIIERNVPIHNSMKSIENVIFAT